jgi:quercetin dioxygenase-like cupin family protein
VKDDSVPPPLRIGHLSPRLRRRVVTIAPGGALPYRRTAWRDAIVVVERGSIELQTSDGGRYVFGRGDVVWLDGLPVRCLRNPGRRPAVLVAVSRRATDPS